MIDWNGNGKMDSVDIGIHVALRDENDRRSADENNTDGVMAEKRSVPPIEEKDVAKPVGCLSMLIIAIALIALFVGLISVLR